MFYSLFVCLFVCLSVSCRQYFEDGYEIDGVYKIFVDGPCERPVKTVCDQPRRFGGGWTLLVKSELHAVNVQINGLRFNIFTDCQFHARRLAHLHHQ